MKNWIFSSFFEIYIGQILLSKVIAFKVNIE